MPAILKEVIDLLEETAPLHAAESWDNPGLQVGRLSQQIDKILIALDPTVQALIEASNIRAQLLLTHHPLIFKSISHISRDDYPGNIIFEAVEREISVFAAHTNLDAAQDGINDMLARLFGLQKVEALLENVESAMDKAGMGRIGDLPAQERLTSMADLVKRVLGIERVKVVGDRNKKIRRVAVVGGSGGRMVSTASHRGADLMITGDIGHHEALEAHHLGLALIDGGHFYTEKAALGLIANRLRDRVLDRGWDIPIETYRDEKSPFHFE